MDGCLLLAALIIKLCDANIQEIQKPIRITKKPLGRLDLLECAVLEPAEYDKYAAKGLCPPQPTKIFKSFGSKLKKLYHGESPWLIRKTKKGNEDLKKKRSMMKRVLLLKQSFYHLRLQNVDFDFELIEGLLLTLECPLSRKIKNPNIEWYLDGSSIITDSWSSWRVKFIKPKYLQISPLMVVQDDGRYECFIDGKPQGSVNLHVITVAEGINRGTVNYFITMTLSIPLVAFAIFYRLLHPQREAIMLDSSVVDFYEKILDLTTEEMKSHITETVHKDKSESKRKEIESKYSHRTTLIAGESMRNNRDAVMTILNIAEINQRKNYDAIKHKVKRRPLNHLKLR